MSYLGTEVERPQRWSTTHYCFLHEITSKDVVIAARLEKRPMNEACQEENQREKYLPPGKPNYPSDVAHITLDLTAHRFTECVPIAVPGSRKVRVDTDENRLCTIRLIGELRPRRLRIEQTALLITYPFFFDFASRRVQASRSISDKADRIVARRSSVAYV